MVTQHYFLGAKRPMDLLSENSLEKAIKAELVLGVSSRACRGNGICSIYTKGALGTEKHYCHFAEVTIQRDDEERLLFTFQMDSMRKSTIEKHFGSTFFEVEESVLLPGFIKYGLRLERTMIKKGRYPIMEFGATFMVIFS